MEVGSINSLKAGSCVNAAFNTCILSKRAVSVCNSDIQTTDYDPITAASLFPRNKPRRRLLPAILGQMY